MIVIAITFSLNPGPARHLFVAFFSNFFAPRNIVSLKCCIYSFQICSNSGLAP